MDSNSHTDSRPPDSCTGGRCTRISTRENGTGVSGYRTSTRGVSQFGHRMLQQGTAGLRFARYPQRGQTHSLRGLSWVCHGRWSGISDITSHLDNSLHPLSLSLSKMIDLCTTQPNSF
ncbi:MAG: hypothetical protein U9N40_03445 [Euryarchaeota archaeon]|nr:hypothetical protein [Euryarchaeota archaeon]